MRDKTLPSSRKSSGNNLPEAKPRQMKKTIEHCLLVAEKVQKKKVCQLTKTQTPPQNILIPRIYVQLPIHIQKSFYFFRLTGKHLNLA